MKRTEYLLDFYHHGDEDVKDAHMKIVQAIREIAPHATVTVEPVKMDHWQLFIEVESA
jgi:hypothetical protein